MKTRATERALLLAGCVLCLGVSAKVAAQASNVPAAGGTRFTSPSGFSLMPPDRWIVATRDQRDQVANMMKGRTDLLKGFDSDRMAVILFSPDDPNSSINVVVSPGRLRIDSADAIDQYGGLIRNQYRQIGVNVEGVTVNRQAFGDHQALVADYQIDVGTLQGGEQPGRMQQRQVVFSGVGKTFIVTCTAAVSSFADVSPLFSSTLNSMAFEAGAFDYFSDLPPWLRNAGIGAVAGALLTLVMSVVKKIMNPGTIQRK